MRLGGTLDRYVLRQWFGTFLLSAIGIPVVATLIHLSEQFGPLSRKGVPVRDILLGEVFFLPYQMTLLLPAAVLFATVFTLNAMGRHSELTAVKAGGVSFWRLILPMVVLAVITVPANFVLQEVAATSSARQKDLHRVRASSIAAIGRWNFAFSAPTGWTYAINELQRSPGLMRNVLLTPPRDTSASAIPAWTIAADSATWSDSTRQWKLFNGAMYQIGDSINEVPTIRFASLRFSLLRESPTMLLDEGLKAEEMRIGQFRAYLDRLERSGTKPGMLAVDYRLKFALPVACLVVALFGAPLAVTNPRAGAAFGLAIALGTTLVYLTGTQIMKAVGGKGYLDPTLAAWSMNALFVVLALILLRRVRS
jgi:lipopolysaccharide export system permease protein